MAQTGYERELTGPQKRRIAMESNASVSYRIEMELREHELKWYSEDKIWVEIELNGSQETWFAKAMNRTENNSTFLLTGIILFNLDRVWSLLENLVSICDTICDGSIIYS